MKKFINIPIFICLFLTQHLADIYSQASEYDIVDVYQKKDNRKWGDIFYSIFNKKCFGKSYALVIGVGDYKKDWPRLESPYHDVCRIRDFLINDANFDYVVTLTNSKVTKDTINILMDEIFPELINENDRFLFYFSGHGTQRKIGKRTLGYLVLQNCGMKSYGDMISMNVIERWDILLSQTKHVLFILDCCFSGLAGLQTYSALADKTIDRLSQYAHNLITAGSADEKSIASLKDWQGSLFTDSFIKGALGRADQKSSDYEADGIVSLKELMKYIGDRIDEESLRLSKVIKMTPQMSKLQDSVGEFFFITKDTKIKKVDKFQSSNTLKNEVEKGLVRPVIPNIKINEISGVSSEDRSIKGIVERFNPQVHEIIVYVEEPKFDPSRKSRFYNQADRLLVNKDGTWSVDARPGKIFIYVLNKGMVKLDMEPIKRPLHESEDSLHILHFQNIE